MKENTIKLLDAVVFGFVSLRVAMISKFKKHYQEKSINLIFKQNKIFGIFSPV